MNQENLIINKTMDLDDLYSEDALKIINELNSLINELKEKQLKISSWYGIFDLPENKDSIEKLNRGYDYNSLEGAADDNNFPWFLYWEIVWIFLNNDFRPEHKILNMGGASSLFSYYLASKGFDVTTIDLKEDLVENANRVAKAMGWNLKNYVMDMRRLTLNQKFDHITSICVYEHIPIYDRIAINENIKHFLKRGGKFSITFDYANPARWARINSPEDVEEQFVKPSGLKIRGNKVFYDNGKRYLIQPFYHKKIQLRYKISCILKGYFSPLEIFKYKEKNDYTFGALFLENS